MATVDEMRAEGAAIAAYNRNRNQRNTLSFARECVDSAQWCRKFGMRGDAAYWLMRAGLARRQARAVRIAYVRRSARAA